MSILLIIALLISAVVAANIIQPFVKRIPEALILILVGTIFSILPIFHGFQIDSEFFLFLIIAPIMFQEGQSHPYQVIRQNSKTIVQLSVVLAFFSLILVTIVSTNLQAKWPLALSVALAAIVVPTDAVAVKSMISGLAMPKGLNQALELESLFNDATGIVLLNLSLTFFSKGTLSPLTSIGYFLFVALGGLLLGGFLSYLISLLRLYLNFHTTSAQATTIPLNFLTPFVIYIIAEHLGVSAILAVVAAGVVHNWERSKMKLMASETQVVTATIWQTLTTILNGLVFVILGLALPTIFKTMIHLGVTSIILIVLSLAIYLAMFLGRFLWVTFQKDQRLIQFFGKRHSKNRKHRARLFGLAGVHGAVTLALAMSLPKEMNGHPFPFLDEIQVVATLVILISLLVASFSLPLMLEKEAADFTPAELTANRRAMIDTAIMSLESQPLSTDVKKSLRQSLQTQKITNGQRLNHDDFAEGLLPALNQIFDDLTDYLHSEAVQQKFKQRTITIYSKILQRGLIQPATLRRPLIQIQHRLHHLWREIHFHTKTRTFTRKQRAEYQNQYLSNHPAEKAKIMAYRDNRQAVWALNHQVQEFADQLLAEQLAQQLASKESTANLDQVRQLLNRFFDLIAHDYQKNVVTIPAAAYIQAFSQEYRFVTDQVTKKAIAPALADQLYHEINLAQTLQLMDQNTGEAEN